MHTLIDRLRETGADMDGAMGRLLGDEALYETCFSIFLEDPAFAVLGESLEREDWNSAFEAAHTLKGVAGNLGLTRIYELTGQLVEPLRRGAPGDAGLPGLFTALTEERERLRGLTR